MEMGGSTGPKTASSSTVFVMEGTPAAKMEVKTSLLDNMIGVGDMVLLEPLSEDSFLENLKKRFDHNEIYTYIGSVVISLNPYRSLPIYTPDKVEEYRNRNFYELSPHMRLVLSAGRTAHYCCSHGDTVPLSFLQTGKTAPLGVVETGSLLETLWNTFRLGPAWKRSVCCKSGVFIRTVTSREVRRYSLFLAVLEVG
ncbi:hypothetical protein CRENBAI_024653 [Crenichthys baileyi]|uniref:Myosin motor domain-containing protein n=1 Tax=Crenichthys baileyi TaxID=28760 RepID=A0AAV9RL30_9TELE